MPSRRLFVVHLQWDEDARVWTASSDDIPGLVTEAETLDGIHRNVRDLVPDLLAANDVILPEPGHVPLRFVHDEDLEIASA
jgi:hypothetical protein